MNFSSELLNKGNKTPAFSISIEGRDITTVLDNRLIGLTLTDNRGFEADQLDLELDDADGKIVLPRRGAVITLALGSVADRRPRYPSPPRLSSGNAGEGQTGRVQSASAQAQIARILCAPHKADVPAINQASFIGGINFLRTRWVSRRFTDCVDRHCGHLNSWRISDAWHNPVQRYPHHPAHPRCRPALAGASHRNAAQSGCWSAPWPRCIGRVCGARGSTLAPSSICYNGGGSHSLRPNPYRR